MSIQFWQEYQESGVSGTLASSLQPLSAAVLGKASIDGTLSNTLAALQVDLFGAASIDGPVISTLPAMTAAFEGIASINGSIASALSALTASLQGEVKMLNFTTNGTLFQTEDRPSDNHATFNPDAVFVGTFSNDNRTVSGSDIASDSTFALRPEYGGKWAFKANASTLSGGSIGVGIVEESDGKGPTYTRVDCAWVYSNGSVGDTRVDNNSAVSVTAFTAGQDIEVIADFDNDEVSFYVDDVLLSTVSKTFTADAVYYFRVYSNTETVIAEFDGYTPQESANLQKTSNLPEIQYFGVDWFNAIAHSPNGTAESIAGAGFEADLLISKGRTLAEKPTWIDRLRGVDKHLFSNLSDDESTASGLASFDSDGFTMSVGVGDGVINENTYDFVYWLWKAGGAAISNTDGSIASSVSVAKAGHFSITSWTGSASSGAYTVGCGIDAPDLYIVKNRDDTAGTAWIVGSQFLSAGNVRLELHQTSGAYAANSDKLADYASSGLLRFGNNNEVGGNGDEESMIAYCFKNTKGLLKVGTYTGNGSSNGPLVYLGFKPRWLLFKSLSSSDGGNGDWIVYDTARYPNNPIENRIYLNLALAESSSFSTYAIDITASGFKWRTGTANFGSNTSGVEYLFVAMADTPFGGINVPPSTAR